MNTFKQAAIEILKKEGKPLHFKDITKLALEAGILETEGATPENTMNAQIILDIRKGEASDFVKTAPSTYGLNKNKKEKKQARQLKKKKRKRRKK